MIYVLRGGLAAVALGTLLLILSAAWPYIVPDSAVRSEEQALAFTEAAATFHGDAFDLSLSDEERAASEAAYTEQAKLLDQAMFRKKKLPGMLRIAGFSATIVGVVLLVIVKSNE